MSEELIPAFVAHALPGRYRIKVPVKTGDGCYFAHLKERLQSCPEVAGVTTNAATGGLLVQMERGLTAEDLAGIARTQALFELRDHRVVTAETVQRSSALRTATERFRNADRWVMHATNGSLDLKSALFLTLLALAVRQILRGHFMVPGFTLLWHALSMMIE